MLLRQLASSGCFTVGGFDFGSGGLHHASAGYLNYYLHSYTKYSGRSRSCWEYVTLLYDLQATGTLTREDRLHPPRGVQSCKQLLAFLRSRMEYEDREKSLFRCEALSRPGSCGHDLFFYPGCVALSQDNLGIRSLASLPEHRLQSVAGGR